MTYDDAWPCHYCYGTGYVWDDGEAGRDARRVTCPVCHGEGVEDEEDEEVEDDEIY